MTIDDLVKAGKQKVRATPELMTAYKQLFREKFGREPVCAGCSFNTDWNRLTGSGNSFNQNSETMSKQTFQLRDKYAIYSYDYVDKESGRKLRVRTYGNLMTEDFAEKFLTNGTKEQLKEREQLFKVLPAKFIEPEKTESDLHKHTIKELHAIAAEKGLPAEEWKSLKKEEIITYLEVKESETE